MGLIKNPSELVSNSAVKMLIYGQPGQGKSTLALSSPNPVLLDFDGGAHRINGLHQVPTLPVQSWDDIVSLLNGNELDPFESIVIDTAGKMLDFMSVYIMRNDPKMRMRDGSLSLKGYGARKVMFINFLSQCMTKRKNLIFVAHEKEDKDGDKRYIRPEIGGSSSADLLKELDLVGYMRANGYQREICWSGTDQFYGKNACNLVPVMAVPTILDQNGMPTGENNLLKGIFTSYNNYLSQQRQLRASYDTLIGRINAAIAKVDSVEAANKLWMQFQGITHVWNSKTAAKVALDAKCASLGLTFNDAKMSTKQHNEPSFFFSPTLLDCFCGYISAEAEWEKYYGDSEEPKYSVSEYEEIKFQELIDRINRVPHEPIEAADKGTAWNDLVDTLLHNTKCGNTKFVRLYHDANGMITEDGEPNAKVIGIRAYINDFTFDFDFNFALNAAVYFGKHIIMSDGMELNGSPTDACLSQVLVEAPIETRYGVVDLYGFIDEMRFNKVYDIKTTSRYEFGKYKDYNQRFVYPYCLIESGMAESIDFFEFTAYALKGGNSKSPLITGTQYSEIYNYDHDAAKKHIKDVCERFIEFIMANKDLITDNNIFKRHSHKH